MQYPVPSYRPIRPGTVAQCPVCEGARFINADGTTCWSTEPRPAGARKCPLCDGAGVYTHKGV